MRLLVIAEDATSRRALCGRLEHFEHEVVAEASPAIVMQVARGSHADALIIQARSSVEARATLGRARAGAEHRMPALFLLGEGAAALRVQHGDELVLGSAAGDVAFATALAELHSAVRGLARRRRARLRLDPSAGVATADGLRVQLTPSESALLEELLAHEGTVVPRERLARAVWGDGAGQSTPGALRTHIATLRGKLDRLDARARIFSARRRGYALELEW